MHTGNLRAVHYHSKYGTWYWYVDYVPVPMLVVPPAQVSNIRFQVLYQSQSESNNEKNPCLWFQKNGMWIGPSMIASLKWCSSSLLLTSACIHVSAYTSPARVKRTVQRQIQAPTLFLQRLDDDRVERTVVLLYNKPPNTVTSHTNKDQSPEGTVLPRRTVYEDIATLKGYVGPADTTSTIQTFQQLTNITSKLHAVGRLDADTSGLLLLTNDGGLIHHVCNPTAKSHDDTFLTKTYQATIMGYHDDDSPGFHSIRTLGVDIGAKYGGMTKPAVSLIVLGHPTSKSTECHITIAEGKNRQVRRMFHAIGSGVIKLRRISIGDTLTLGDLTEGQWRLLNHEEVKNGLGWEPRVLPLVGGHPTDTAVIIVPRNGANLKLGKARRSRRK